MGGGDCQLPDSSDEEDILDPMSENDNHGGQYDDTFDILAGNSPIRYIGFDRRGSHSSLLYQTPNGTKYWVPDVEVEFKPVVGSVFNSWNDVLKMYETYVEKSGVGVRVGAYKKRKGSITHRMLVCNKAGKPKGKKVDTLDPMTHAPTCGSAFKVTNCKALIRLKLLKGLENYVLYEFLDKHNHDLASSDDMDLLRRGKHLNFNDINFIHTMSLNRVGPTVAHHLRTALKGGHHNMRGTRNVYKNVGRDIRMFIGDRDINMVATKLKERATFLSNFSYEMYHNRGELKAIFWVDGVSKTNYDLFGDVLAFDATYSTNKYNMIFVPFTGVDHHKRCVTFGAGLIHNETAESYKWLLSSFLKIHGRQPNLVLTDQDPAMRVAVAEVFTKSVHRLCMWHIMKTLPSKISFGLFLNSNLRSSIHKLAWNVYIIPAVFEERWMDLISKFKLNDHVWLRDVYAIRHSWVPAYFQEIPLCCLMKTTSRCESSNALFKVNSSSANTLVQFFMCYDTFIDNQRYNQRTLEFQTNQTRPDLRTGLEIEAHAATLCTHTLFKQVQKEIAKGMMNCFIINVDAEEQFKVYTISHMDKRTDFVNEFKLQVHYHLHERSYDCSCMGFTRIGYLCRHIFCVFRIYKVTQIPDRYVYKRWRRLALPSPVYSLTNRLQADTSDHSILKNELLDCVSACVECLRDDIDGLGAFSSQIKELNQIIIQKYHAESSSMKRNNVMRDLLGNAGDDADELAPPQGIRNKGCGTNRRLVGPGERAIKRSLKKFRKCRTCNLYTDHDSRNCKIKETDVNSPCDTSSDG